MKKICVLTGTRAEYGLLKPLIEKIANDEDLMLCIVATGMHLSSEFGLTYKEIEQDGFVIDDKIEIPLLFNTNEGMAKSTGTAIINFAEYFERNRPDMLVLLGDRFETFACATSAAIAQIPIAHLFGGDTTEGAVDEFFRHSITKMCYLHFTSSEKYKKRVEQLGENPNRVFNVGSIGIENISTMDLLPLSAVETSLNFKLDKEFALVTFHPETMTTNSPETQFNELLTAIDNFDEMQFVFTKANADAGGRLINNMIDDYVGKKDNCVAVTSLGVKLYLSAMKHAKLVIGNSSSGIYEAPSFKIATINIGDRQKGRIQADSIINCVPFASDIVKAMHEGLNKDCQNTVNPYQGANPSQEIVDVIKDFLQNDKIDLKKKFWDIEV